ncbi:hypothetical protein GQ600_13455 [Phytophthora cactorum]|nr:hypothetical protein GQ600_13455 [Phytophthora cactorum]
MDPARPAKIRPRSKLFTNGSASVICCSSAGANAKYCTIRTSEGATNLTSTSSPVLTALQHSHELVSSLHDGQWSIRTFASTASASFSSISKRKIRSRCSSQRCNEHSTPCSIQFPKCRRRHARIASSAARRRHLHQHQHWLSSVFVSLPLKTQFTDHLRHTSRTHSAMTWVVPNVDA